MTVLTDNPHAIVEDACAAAREVLGAPQDGRGGYLLSAERDGEGVRLGVGRLRLTHSDWRWTDEDIGTVHLLPGDDVEQSVLGLPGLPRCSCGCGAVVLAPGFVNGHTRRRFAAGGTCRHGHLLTPDQVYESPGGQRECRACRAAKSAARAARQKREAA